MTTLCRTTQDSCAFREARAEAAFLDLSRMRPNVDFGLHIYTALIGLKALAYFIRSAIL